MAKVDYKGWPDQQQKNEKPFDRAMPFHRVKVPANQFIQPFTPPPGSPFVIRPKVISGDAYSVGARSSKNYDAKFGEDLGKELADLAKNVFPPLRIIDAPTHALAALIGQIPGLKPLADVIDGLDPLAELLKFIGSNVDALLVDSFIRSIPAWVPVFDEKIHPDFQILELDGIVVRSFQRIDSNPFWQWSRWYSWHFAVCPSPIFHELIGFGNLHRDDDNKLGEPTGTLINYHKEGLPVGATISAAAIADCDWDIGAIGLRQGVKRTGPGNEDRLPVFFDQLQPRVKHDWCWPMAGMFFWAIGRCVYDCTHATENNAKRTIRKDRKPQGQGFSEDDRRKRGVHINQLNPMKALATARWEAFQFKENPKPVPAIQFMFYANVHLSSAGFFDKSKPSRSPLPPLNDQDYEFIVDLPNAVVTSKSEYPVGHTPDFALNTLVLQPRIVVNADFAPFQKDSGGGTADGVVEDSDDRTSNELTVAKGPVPIVTLFGGKPGEAPRQASVRIPLKGNVSQDITAYGVLLSIGWLDPDGLSATQVKKVTVTLQSINPVNPDSDADWNLNVGVNGRWFLFRFNAKGKTTVDLASISGNQPVTLVMLLAEEDVVMVSAHGFEEDPYDGLMRLLPEFPAPRKRPNKKAPSLPSTTDVLDDPAKLGKFKADTLERLKVLDDRILRLAAEATVPTSKPDAQGNTKKTKIVVPMVGDEIDWDNDVDTDNDTQASVVARAMFLRLAVGNRFDANDLLGMLDPNVPDPLHTNPPARRSADGTDTANPLIVADVVKEVGIGNTKRCQATAYKSEVVGRMGAMAYDPTKPDYTLIYDVKVEDLPAS